MTIAAMNHVGRLHLALCAGAAVASLALVSPGFAASLAIGAVIATLNFRHLLRGGKSFFGGRQQNWNAGFGIRLAVLGIAMGAALYFGAHPVGLVIGLSMIMPAAIIEAWRHRPPVDPAAPALAPDDPSWDRWNAWLAREREADGEEEDS